MIGRHSDLSVYEEIFRSSDFLKIVFGGMLIPITLGISKLSGNNISMIVSGLLLLSVAINGLPIILEAFQGIIKKKINVDELVSIAIIACLVNGNYLEAATVSFIMVFGAMIEEAVSDSARKSIQGLIDVTPDVATVLEDGKEVQRNVAELLVGDIILVRPGETIPVDGIILEGITSIDESSLTGESIPVDKENGSQVSAGTINMGGFIKLSAEKIGQDSTIGKVIDLVKSAEQTKLESARIVDKYATWFTPIILAISILTFFITKDIDRAITVLIVGCPCSFLLAGPVSTVAAIGRLAKAGILVKGGIYLEKIATATGVYFDKTGTLTYGNPEVVEIIKVANYNEKQIINFAANVEYGSRHPLAKAIVKKAEALECQIHSANEITIENGKGVSGLVENKRVWVGTSEDSVFNDKGMTFVSVKVEGLIIGHIGIFDDARPEAKKVMNYLKVNKMDVAIISGDQDSAVEKIAKQIGVESYFARLKPDEKMEKITQYSRGPLIYVGDGINDAPALKTSDAGIAMGLRGSDVALQTADIVLLNDKIELFPFLIKLSRRMSTTIRAGIAISLIINVLSIIAGSMGLLTPILGAISHNIGSIAVVLLSASISFEKYEDL